jgi:uncharacterized protein
MRTVWDELKRERNVREHRLDFADVDSFFDFAQSVVIPTYAGRDGRYRFKAIGTLKDKLVVLIFSPLGTEAISLISLRPAGRQERRLYEEHHQGSTSDHG